MRYNTDENKSMINVRIGDEIIPTVIDPASTISIWSRSQIPKNCKLIPYVTNVRGIAGRIVQMNFIAFIKFKIGNTSYSHYFRIIEQEHIGPLIGQDLLKRLQAKLDLEENIISFYKKPRKPILPHDGNKDTAISQTVIQQAKENISADVIITKHITIPAKSYFFLPVSVKNLKEKQQSAYIYIHLLQSLRDKYGLRNLSLKMPVNNCTILVINPTSKKINLKKKHSSGIH